MKNFDWKVVVGSVRCCVQAVAILPLSFDVTTAWAVRSSAVLVWFNNTSYFRSMLSRYFPPLKSQDRHSADRTPYRDGTESFSSTLIFAPSAWSSDLVMLLARPVFLHNRAQ